MISLRNVALSMVAIVFVATIIDAQQLQSKTADAASPSVTNPSLSEVKGSRLMQLSGVLKDPSGRPLSGVVGILTSLYKDPDGGTALWSETQNVQLDAQGNYSLLLGATTGEGIPLDILSSSEPRWLGVQALAPGNGEQPRFLLVSVPYALKAADADTLGGKPLSAFVLSHRDGKNGSTSPDGGKRSPSGSTQDEESQTSAITNPGTSGHFAKYVNSTDLGDAVSTEDSSGNISSAGSFTGAAHWLNGFGSLPNANGFAMSAPNTVIFATNAQESLKIDSSGNVTARVGSFTGAAHWLNGFGSSPNANGFAMSAPNTLLFSSNAQPRMTIDSSGNIGIGTMTPTQKLDVAGAAKVTSSVGASIDVHLAPAAFAAEYTGTGGVGVVGYGSDPVAANVGVVGASNSSAGWGGAFANFKSTGRSLSAFDSALNETFLVGANGKVSIGGTGSGGPTNLAKLTLKVSGTGGAVNGTGTVSITNGSTTLTGSGTAFLSELAVGDRIGVTSTNQFFVISAIASDTSATVTSSTGTTTAGSAFTIQQAFFRLDDSGGTARMVIQNRGNSTPRLGIGTVSPTSALDVRGTVFTNDKMTIGPNSNKRSQFTVKGNTFSANLGTVSVSNSSTTVTGTNTLFLSQVGLGDRIQIGAPVSETRTVVDITDDLTLTVDSPFSTASNGVTSTTIPALIRADDVSGTPKFIVNDVGNIGIGTLLPKRELEVNGGMRLNTITAKPACDATSRGTFWVTQSGAGVKDSVEVCVKDASDLYAWRILY